MGVATVVARAPLQPARSCSFTLPATPLLDGTVVLFTLYSSPHCTLSPIMASLVLPPVTTRALPRSRCVYYTASLSQHSRAPAGGALVPSTSRSPPHALVLMGVATAVVRAPFTRLPCMRVLHRTLPRAAPQCRLSISHCCFAQLRSSSTLASGPQLEALSCRSLLADPWRRDSRRSCSNTPAHARAALHAASHS